MRPLSLSRCPRTAIAATLVAFALPHLVHAQVVLLHEDFSQPGYNYIPLGWDKPHIAIPTDWFMGFPSTNGCFPGWDGRALLCDDELWSAGACGVSRDGGVWTPVLTPPAGVDVRITFDSFLDIDSAGGDRAQVAFYRAMFGSPAAAVVATDATLLLQAGVWQSVQVDVPASAFQQFLVPPWDGFSVNFDLRRNSSQPRAGWAIDNVHVEYGALLNANVSCAQHFPAAGGYTLPCPCQNLGAEGTGCSNHLGGPGAVLEASGFDSALLDDVKLSASGLPPQKSALLARGAPSGVPFVAGSGVSCLATLLTPLGVRTADAQGLALWGGPGFVSANGWAPGTLVHLQVLYRDPQPGGTNCNPNGPDDFNWTPLVAFTLAP